MMPSGVVMEEDTLYLPQGVGGGGNKTAPWLTQQG